jgi:hypothetical protein
VIILLDSLQSTNHHDHGLSIPTKVTEQQGTRVALNLKLLLMKWNETIVDTCTATEVRNVCKWDRNLSRTVDRIGKTSETRAADDANFWASNNFGEGLLDEFNRLRGLLIDLLARVSIHCPVHVKSEDI